MILERKMAVLFNKKYSHLAFRPCDCNWNYAGHAMGEKSANARWLLHPIFNNQAMHTLELSDVVCDQNHISSDLACAAISISSGPIGVPLSCR